MISKKKKICYNCENTILKNFKKSSVKKEIADWKKKISLKTKFPADKILPLKINYPKEFNKKYHLKISKKYAGRYIYYYAAESKNINEILKTKYSVDAYGNFLNKGVCKIDKEGYSVLKFNCPQNYYVDKNNIFISHIHYLISDKQNKKWLEKLYTERVICNIKKDELKELIKKNNAIVINALPFQEYIKKHIPNSFSLPYDIVTKNMVSNEEIYKYLENILPNYPNIDKLYRKNKISLENIPIIVYCYKKSCNAGEKLINKLAEYGFTNIMEYSEGVVDWFEIN